jgi:glutathione S-transferase
VNPYEKPKVLVDISPQGLVPAIRHGPTWSAHESAVIVEYVEELVPGLLPPADQKQARATARLWAQQINSSLVPLFYRALQAQEASAQAQHLGELAEKLERVLEAAHPEGPFFSGPEFGWVDVFIAPWLQRFSRVLKPYRAWPDPEPGSRLEKWTDAVEAHPAVKATTSLDSHYIDAYRRYAGEQARGQES